MSAKIELEEVKYKEAKGLSKREKEGVPRRR